MDYSRLTKLLQSIAARIDRMLKYASHSGATTDLSDILVALQVTASHYLSEPAQLTNDGIGDLRQLIDDVRLRLSEPSLQVRVALPDGGHDTLAARLKEDCVALSNRVAGLAIGLALNEPGESTALLPEQKVAPFKFELAGGRLVVKNQAAKLDERRTSLVSAARRALLEQGEKILDDLRTSNRSPRLRQSFEMLQEKLAGDDNIIALGMFNRTCSLMIGADIDEMPDTLVALLVAQVEGTNSLLAQYPEWQEFSQASVLVDMDQNAIADLISTARHLAERLKNDRLTASESVPKALEQVADWAEQGTPEEKGRVLSLGRTLENLLSVVIRAMVAFGKDVAQEARKGAAKAVVGVLLGAAALGYGAAAGRIPGGEWVQGAISYLRDFVAPQSASHSQLNSDILPD